MSLAVLGAAVAVSPAAAADTGRTSRVNVSSSGRQASGGGPGAGAAISGNGRYVVFSSSATNLVRGDTNGVDDLFLRDRWSGTTRRISVSSTGEQAGDLSFEPSISADGRYVVFVSYATNLVPDDTDGYSDIFLRDVWAGTTRMVDVAEPGGRLDQDLLSAAIGADGREIVFSSVSGLVPGDTNGTEDVYVHDLTTGVSSLVSRPAQPGTLGNGGSYWPSMSATGRYVAFCSWASDMVPGDTNGSLDVFLRDRLAGTTVRVSLTGDGRQVSGRSDGPSVSADGRYVAFHSEDPGVVAGDTNGEGDVFLRDLRLGATTTVSVNPSGQPGRWASSDPQITPDGRAVVFDSWADDLVPNDTNQWYDAFRRDLSTGRTSRVSVSSTGAQGDLNSANPQISTDGRHVVFVSDATNLVPGDTNDAPDIFVRDLP